MCARKVSSNLDATGAESASEMTTAQLVDVYRKMVQIRSFEEKACALYAQGLVPGTIHPYVGQEAIAAGASAAMEERDSLTSNHRGHGHCIARGGDMRRMMAELMGKATGYCGGRGGSMHITAADKGVLGANGIVGGGIPIAVGAGLASKLQHSGEVTVCFFGDGAAHTGSFHEGLNLAAIWGLPVVFICENNLYGMSVALSRATLAKSIAGRAEAYGMPGVRIDGNDVFAVHEAVQRAIRRARAGGGPTLIEAVTYTMIGHYFGDPCNYRTDEEVAEWAAKDPIGRFKTELLRRGVLSEDISAQIVREAVSLAEEADRFARSSPMPDPATVQDHVFADVEHGTEAAQPVPAGSREITYCEAITEALREEMRRDERVTVFGEDVAVFGGCFGATKGLLDEFGEDRVRDTPISEAAIAGAAVGSAMKGLRPVAEIMYIDFSTIAMDQIVNQAAKLRYMSGGQLAIPMVIRTAGGARRRNAAQHSASLEAWYAHTPGLIVVMPSTPYDAKGLLKAAIRAGNPVIFIEHKMLYRIKGPVPVEEYVIPLGVADIKRAGTDVTVVATSLTVGLALKAASRLEADGVSVEVIDPRTVSPLDMATILTSVKKTGRLVVVSEESKRGSLTSEIAASVVEDAFDCLDAPIIRVAALDVPVPYSPVLEDAALPGVDDIVQGIRKTLARAR